MAESADIQDILKKVEYINNNLISTKKISDISKGSDNEKSETSTPIPEISKDKTEKSSELTEKSEYIENKKNKHEKILNSNDNKGSDHKNQPKKNKKKKEKKATYQIPLYVTFFVFYFYFGVIIPLYLLFTYLMKVFIPLFIEAGGPKTWDSWSYTFLHPIEVFNSFLPILQNPLSLFIFLTSPLVFIGIYLLKMLIYACIVKFMLWGFKLIHPRKELINALPRGDTAKDVGIYYNRNFVLRMIKWEFSKSMFPWLLNWVYNFINTNKIGKNCTFEDGYVCQEYLETGTNVYVGYGTVTTSHLVEGIYGALILKKIKLANNVCIGSRCAIPPGTEFAENSEMLWYSGVIKYQKVKPGVVYWGLPASRLTKQKYYKLIKLPKEFQDEKKEKKESEDESIENISSNSSNT